VADFSFQWEIPVHAAFPGLHDDLSAFLAQVDELSVLDRKTRELIRMVASVATRSPKGVERHAMLAREFGASWNEVLGAIVLTMPALGMQPAVDAIGPARQGFDAAPLDEPEDPEGLDDGAADAAEDD
jgi:AhpD family alkylhydroperoxidase